MTTSYILGAGFSNAVADLPVTKDWTQRFWEILDQEAKAGHKNRVRWGTHIREYLDYLEREFFTKPLVNVEGGQRYTECNFQENLEALISFIDLNMSGEITARLIDKDGKRSSISKRTLFWNFTDLDQLRHEIQAYIFLTLIEPKTNDEIVSSFVRRIAPNDNLITFNYDLIVERALYDQGMWKPKDGYGIEFKNFPPVSDAHNSESRIQIYKLHGSLNWEEDLRLRFFYDNQEPIFPGYLREDSKRPKYQGGHSGLWMLPSFVKQFAEPELLHIWRYAFAAIEQSQEVVVIGYSLPKEDSAACLLFGTTDIASKRLTIVDRNADALLERYESITRNKGIEKFDSLTNFLNDRPSNYRLGNVL